MERLIVYGTRWCRDTIKAREVLYESHIDYEYIDINQNVEGERFVKETNHGNRSVPTIVFPNKSILIEPSKSELLEELKTFNVRKEEITPKFKVG